MDIPAARAAIAAARAALDAADVALQDDPPAQTVRVVQPEEDLQAALDAGGPLQLVAGATYRGNFVLPSNTDLNGNDAIIEGQAGLPALRVLPGSHDILVSGLTVSALYPVAIQLGRNDTQQTTLESVPEGITMAGVDVLSHRGKRAFEINSRRTTLLDCEVYDTYDPGGQDSQAVAILNTPGDVTIRDGIYQAGSEVVLVGGDTVKIPGVVPTNILLEDVELSRPLSWRTDGINRKVKNLFEVKAGISVTLRRATLQGNWLNSQTGFAIVLTPANGAYLDGVVIEDCTIRDTAGGILMTGRQDGSWTPVRTRNVIIRGNQFTVDKSLGTSSTGRFLQLQQEVHDVTAEDNTFTGNIGSALMVGDYATVMNEDGTTRKALGLESLVLRNNRFALGSYGIWLAGQSNGTGLPTFVTSSDISGNTFGGGSTQQNTGTNTYISRADFDVLVGR